jgi:CheY-like chemotaxis protein
MSERSGAPRVLVIEDDPVNLELTVALLENERYAVSSAGTAEEGIRLARRERPDLILMDVRLPGRTGLDAARELKADSATTGIPIVALTAQALAGDRERALAAGCDDYCAKPVDAEQFRAVLRRFLDRKPV